MAHTRISDFGRKHRHLPSRKHPRARRNRRGLDSLRQRPDRPQKPRWPHPLQAPQRRSRATSQIIGWNPRTFAGHYHHMKKKRPYTTVYPLAQKLAAALAPVCERIELAGSLRRESAEIGDIELVAIPRSHVDLFGNPLADTLLDDLLNTWQSAEKIHLTKNGKKYKQFEFRSIHGLRYQVDLFVQPDPATWGINYLIRTGSADFSRHMVTRRSADGAMPDRYTVKDARVWCDGRALDTPEEADVFRLWGLPYIEPPFRTVDRLQVAMTAVAAITSSTNGHIKNSDLDPFQMGRSILDRSAIQ